MRRVIAATALLLATMGTPPASASAGAEDRAQQRSSPAPVPPDTQQEDGFDIAITVDDLPAHGILPPGTSRLQIAQEHLATLKAHGVPQAFGFVNAGKLANEPEGAAVLNLWREGGQPLGNHTLSHMNLTRAPSLEAWIADLAAGEEAVASRMAGQDWRWLRFPNLAAAGTGERHQGAMAYLRTHHYRVAEVSIAFSDWSYTDAHARCLATGDTAAIAAMEGQYFDQVDAAIARARALSQAVYGRTIPLVLLTHVGGWSARTLDGVLDRLDAAGARYVTLQAAQADPAYDEADPAAGNGSLLERAAAARDIDVADHPAPSLTLQPTTLCR